MSPVTRTRRDGRVRPARYRSLQPGMLVWLTLVWVMLWGDFSPKGAVGGLLVAVVVCLVFPLPPLRLHVRVRPLALVWLAVRFLADIVVASWQVSLATFRRELVTSAVIGVQLRTPSDFVMTVVGEMLSLVPGSVVVEAERSTYTLYLHVFDIDDEEQAEAFRRTAWAQEERVVRAFGRHLDHLSLPPAEAQARALDRLAEDEGEVRTR